MLLITAVGLTNYIHHRSTQSSIYQNIIIRKQLYVAFTAYAAEQ